ncbi:type VII toxin-antitoxin system HepT family RNase toxin [Salibacterium sp. K-3]
MYFVDRKKIEEILTYMETLTEAFKTLEKVDSRMEKLAVERMAQGWVEAVTDTGNQLIDGFVMRDPGSYEDIIDILEDEKVVPAEEAEGLKAIIGFRRTLLQDYYTIDVQKLYDTLSRHLKALEHFPGRVRGFLEAEPGTVSAFLPEEEHGQ